MPPGRCAAAPSRRAAPRRESVNVPFARNFKRRPQAGDLIAGVSVACVGVPQSLAYAELAGLPPQYGLLALAAACIAAAPFVSSRYVQTGPVALVALLTLGVLSSAAETGVEERLERAALLALLVGLIMVALGAVRLGRAVYLLSEPMIAGFTTGAVVLIVAAQLPKAVDVDIGDRSVLAGAVDVFARFREWNWQALALAAATAALMLVSDRIHKLFPDVLVAMIAGVLLTGLGYSGATVGSVRISGIGLSLDLPWASAVELLVPALVIALAGFAETASISRRLAVEDRLQWNADHEVVSQGVANLAAGLVGVFPVAGSISRSALSRTAGATSAWAGAATGVIVLAVLPLTFLLEKLPLAVLGAIVIVVVARLVNIQALTHPGLMSWPQAVVSFGTLVATVGMAPRIERGLLIGVGLAISVHLYRELYVDVSTMRIGTLLVVRPRGVLWFATVPQVERLMREQLARHRSINSVVIDLGGVGRIDYSGAASLSRVLSDRISHTVQVNVVGVPDSASRAVRAELKEYAKRD